MRLRSREIHNLQSSVGFVCDGRIVVGNSGDKTDRRELVGFQSKKEAAIKEHLLERALDGALLALAQLGAAEQRHRRGQYPSSGQ